MVDADNRQKAVPAYPDGMSGGGVWIWPKQPGEFCLAGIVTEFDEQHKALIGTRMIEMLRLVKNSFPETIPYLPRCVELGNLN